MRHIATFTAAVAAAALFGACAPSVPDEPTWTEDVRPIVTANCTRCHTPPPLEGAPDNVRFDKYDDEDRDGNGSADMYGTGSEAMIMATRVQAEEMPLDFPLLPRQQDIIADWADAGAPKGEPREGNRAPTMEIISDFEQDGDLLVADYRIDDPDFDLVTGRLVADPDGDGDLVVVTFDLFSGVSQIVWDAEGVPSGPYSLTAEIEDGSAEVTVELGSVDVP
ncbi:MAG TPA: hypothetical protein VK698_28750 [Kofleriaceae bacterium]|nr:hypothetical protein [Kofleriaceae bacterium]